MNVRPAAEFNPQSPQVGIYRGVSDESYFAANAVNHSTLKEIERSPAHYKLALKKGGRDSDAKRLGAVAHLMLFQPSLVAGKIVGPPINPKTDKPYGMDTNAWRDHAAEHPGKLIVSPQEMQDAALAVQAIREHRELAPIMCESVENELVLVWEEDGILFKAKIDALTSSDMGDLKTTKNAEDRAFARSIAEYSYHTQAALYLRGAIHLGISVDRYVIGAVEQETYQIACYELDSHFISIGHTKVTEWIGKLRNCLMTDEWPGYTPKIVPISPPMWLLSQFADAE